MSETAEKTIVQAEQTMSERFMHKVLAEFNSGVGDVALTDFQKRLAQNYFIAIDAALKTAEENRLSKNKWQKDANKHENTPVTWANVNMALLARNVVAYARVGLDPSQKNHINLIPFKDNGSGKYNIVFIEGYRGLELKAKKYGLDVPDAVIVELVYSNDFFLPIKKDRNNKVESYEFQVKNAFDRGAIVGGFYYHIYSDKPEKNRLTVMTLKDIEKRKPPYASAEFWGGEKDVWENGKKTGKKKIEGWLDQMCLKTIYRAAYNGITIDSQKIDDDYLKLSQMERTINESKVAAEIAANANAEALDIESEVISEDIEDNGEVSKKEANYDPGF